MKVIAPNDITIDSSNVDENAYNDWASGTTYSAGDRVYYVGVEPHRIYEALQSTTGDVPPDNPSQWALVGSSNRWAMFDGSTSSVTERSTSIDVSLSLSSRADRVALFGLQAETVDVVVKETGGTVIDSTTYTLLGESVLVADLPGLRQSFVIDLTINASTARCGQVVVGFSFDLGRSQYGYDSGIQDFSRREVNDFGQTTLIQRNFGKVLEVDLFLEKMSDLVVDKRFRKLADLRATPVAWDGLDLPATGFTAAQKESLVVFGFYRRFAITHQNANVATMRLEIEGMT